MYLIEDGNTDDGSDTSKDAIFFSATEVLLDNQAGWSIFKNRSLLHYTSAVAPFYIGGIDSTSRGLRISEEGDFEDLGRVACETTAAANILSNARLLDADNAVSYNQSQDVYHLQGNQKTYVSSRKMLRNGLRFSHYACGMANTDQTFVTTVADNMRQYTKREVDQANVDRELMARLGNPSTQATISMPDAGVSNCAVTKQDVRNADAIFGSSIPAMEGKTHKKASTPASAVIAPRVTQVQQMLAVDLFFVKKIPFLLG